MQRFDVRGNTLLSEQMLNQALTNAVGRDVSFNQLFKALAELHRLYELNGFRGVSVLVPPQEVENGVIIINVVEGSAALAHESAVPAPKPLTFDVRRYEIAGNTLLPPEAIENIFTNAIGRAVSLDQIRSAAGALQLAYREHGFVTVAVSVPPQQVTNATVRVKVIEGTLADIRIAGNRYFSSNNVMRSLPSLRTNTYLNNHILQRELDVANQNHDRQIYPNVGPGPEPATSALTLEVKDRLPLHGRLELNNQATPGTPDWRVNSSLQYANLWQHEHELGLFYGFTPNDYKADGLVNDYLLNRPLVANYGAYYRMPFGNAESVAERINSSTGLGYDEATHQFRFPPAGARPDLTVVVSSSSSDTGVKPGPETVVTQTPLLRIVSQDSGENISVSDSAGGRLSWPFPVNDTRRFAMSFGTDWKHYLLKSFNTNNFFITTVVTNTQGSQTIESQVSSAQPERRGEVDYLPISLGADYFEQDPNGSSSVNVNVSANFLGDKTDFSQIAYSGKAQPIYGKFVASLARDQTVFKNWSLLLRASAQAASGPLLNNEQFALGGLNSVRGYFEGDEYGDAGWFASAEMRTPFITSQVPVGMKKIPVFLRGFAFVDFGQRFLMDSASSAPPSLFLSGTGFGVSANVNNHVDMRIFVGWPLADSANTVAGDPRAYFTLGGQF